MSGWRHRLEVDSESRRRRGLERFLRPVAPAGQGHLARDGRDYIDLSSNDYLGLSREPEVVDAAIEATARFGTGARASRLVTGDHLLLRSLEEELASFKGSETALVFPSGYQANLGLLSLLLTAEDAVFVDRLAHACVVDGVRLSPARLRVFPHNDLDRLEQLLAEAEHAPARWILVDGVYSMDGDFAPLDALLRLAATYDATIVMDDAHGTGIAGRTGRGTAERFGLRPADFPDRLIVVATLSKALGAQGGVVLGPADLREALINASRPFVYSTGLAPGSAGAALAAVRLLKREPERVCQLQELAKRARTVFKGAGLNLLNSETAIVPIVLGEPERALEAMDRLKEQGMLAVAIRPPTVPRGTSRLRVTISTAPGDKIIGECCQRIADLCLSLLSPQANK